MLSTKRKGDRGAPGKESRQQKPWHGTLVRWVSRCAADARVKIGVGERDEVSLIGQEEKAEILSASRRLISKHF